MTLVNWLGSDTASWIFFGIGVFSAALAIVVSPYGVRDHGRLWLVTRLVARLAATIMGPLLLLGGAVLAGTGTGRLSWLSILAGAICVAAVAYRTLRMDIHAREIPTPFRTLDTAHWISDTISRELRYLLRDELRAPALPLPGPPAPTTSEIADAVYRRLHEHGMLPPRTVETFDEFASSMVRRGAWAPVSIYTAADDGTRLRNAVVAVLEEFGLAIAVEEPEVRGSWFQRCWARIREAAGSVSVRGRLAKLEEAVQLEYLGKRRAEIDRAKAEAVAALLGCMKDQENAILRIGSIIAIKAQGDLVVWTISEMQAAALEKNSDLLGDPVAALTFLRSGGHVRPSPGLEPPIGDALSD